MELILWIAVSFAAGCLVTFLILMFLGRDETEPEIEGDGWETSTGEDGSVKYSWRDYFVSREPNPTLPNRIMNWAEMEKPVDRFVWVGTERGVEVVREENLLAVLEYCEALEARKR